MANSGCSCPLTLIISTWSTVFLSTSHPKIHSHSHFVYVCVRVCVRACTHICPFLATHIYGYNVELKITFNISNVEIAFFKKNPLY